MISNGAPVTSVLVNLRARGSLTGWAGRSERGIRTPLLFMSSCQRPKVLLSSPVLSLGTRVSNAYEPEPPSLEGIRGAVFVRLQTRLLCIMQALDVPHAREQAHARRPRRPTVHHARRFWRASLTRPPTTSLSLCPHSAEFPHDNWNGQAQGHFWPLT